ncbi:glycosyltransferase [Flavobacterium restrictum]|uniref:Glycosyltransferase n=1 Tax=Flavobacterium restrictum TaxID=2594428 RepID=A0A553E584_9FLAO|nr:glycosyltransferase [Flavobacterium restrictum]TRX40135.1 glycosyltransferase [Flavobacterium restrictum]
MKKISIIIVTYNSLDLIQDCIDSIFNFSDVLQEQIEIIVVDNSDDVASFALFELIKKRYSDSVLLLKNKTNLGYGHGNNLGINASTGTIVCVMNPDVRFTEPLLKDVFQKFESNQKLGLLGYKQMGGKNLSFYLKPENQWSIFSSGIVKLFNRINFFNSNNFYLSGAFVFLDKSKFSLIGKFDENIFLHYEEPDIANRFLKKGYDIYFSRQKKYQHLIGERKTVSDFTIKVQSQSLKYYLEKFNIDKRGFCNQKKIEYQLKISIARLIKDHERVANFENELKNILEILKD